MTADARLTPENLVGRQVADTRRPRPHREETSVKHTVQYAVSHRLGLGRLVLFGVLFTVAAAVGAAGAVGTFSNARATFRSDGSAVGLVAAGEGGVLMVGLVMVGYAVIHLPRPKWMRCLVLGVPLAASVAGAVIAPTVSRAVLYAVTPLGMTVAAELSGMLAHAIVVYRTGVDVEALARTADTTRRLAYLRSAAANHPEADARRRAELKAWKLAKCLGADDTALGSDLAAVQRERLTTAADDALSAMFALPAPTALAPVAAPLAISEITESPESVSDSTGESTDDDPVAPGSELAYAVSLLADTPPAWDGLNLREAVHRADALVPGLTAPMLSAALHSVGIEATPASIRGTRSALRRIGKDTAQ